MHSEEQFWLPHIGQMVGGRYRLNNQLFVSGPEVNGYRAATWQATDNALSRSVQMQILGPEDNRVPSFLSAARAAVAFDDCRFMRVLDAMEAEGQELLSFVVWEYPEGKRLNEMLASSRLSNAEAAFIVREIAQALAPAHAAGKFHGRLNVNNVVITLDGMPRVSGFLTDNIIYGDGHDSWQHRESADMHSLGVLLYACLTGCVPLTEEESRCGLPAAPRRGAGDKQHWVSPKELRTSTNSGLDKVTMMLLGASNMKFGTVDELAATLTRILSNTEPQAELQNKIRSMRFAISGNRSVPGNQDDRPTQVVANTDLTRGNAATSAPEAALDTSAKDHYQPVETPAEVPAESPATTTSGSPMGYFEEEASDVESQEKSIPVTVRQPLGASNKFFRPRLLALIVTLALVAVLGISLRACGGSGKPEYASEIVNAFSFDPVADGGGENERAETDQLAHDGDPSTAWTTWTYYGSEKFGNLKTGAGMVLDLGSPQQLAGVHLLLASSPVDVQLMIPAADPNAEQPPMDTVNSWQTIVDMPQAGSDIELRPDEPVTTRWALVYFTTLPSVAEGEYRTGIAEVNLVD